MSCTSRAAKVATTTAIGMMIRSIRDCIAVWNANPRTFQGTTTADEVLAKVQLVRTNIKQLVDNDAE